MTLKNTDNASIKIINHQTDDGISDVIDTNYKGRFYENNGKFYIMYKEGDGVSCMIKADADTITINRSGAASSVMVCKKGKEHSFLYKTQYGAVPMSIKTEHVNVQLGKNGGKIELEYVLYVNGGNIINKMDINIKA